MAMRAREDPALDGRDLALLEALREAQVLSTSQLSSALPGQTLGKLVERLKRLAIAGWVGCVAHVPSPNGRVTVWFRTDQAPPGNRVDFAAAALPLGALYGGLRHGPRAFRWSLDAEKGSFATLELPGQRRFLIALASSEAELLAHCDRFRQQLELAPDAALANGLPCEILVLAQRPEQRERLQAVAGAWRTRHPESNLAPHVTTGSDALRVLRTLVHGELLALERLAPPVANQAMP